MSSLGMSSLLDMPGTGQPQAWLDKANITLFVQKNNKKLLSPSATSVNEPFTPWSRPRLNHDGARPYFSSADAHKFTSHSGKYGGPVTRFARRSSQSDGISSRGKQDGAQQETQRVQQLCLFAEAPLLPRTRNQPALRQ